MIIEDWRINYSANRPHSAHRGLSPAEFSLQWTMNRKPIASRGVVDFGSGVVHAL